MTWRTDPINCRRLGQLAGEAPGGVIRYCRTCNVATEAEGLAAGNRPTVLISSGSDAVATAAMAARLPRNVKRWFTTNCGIDPASALGARVEALPIGFTACSGDILRLLIAQATRPRARKNLLLINHRRTHSAYKSAERVRLYNAFRPFRWATMSGDLPQADYYAELAAHDYTLSPAGAGPDCHRTWEALALGTIPIVRRSVYTDVLDEMPALQVEDWPEAGAERLEAELPRLRARFHSPAMQRLTLTYWRKRMEAALCA